MSTIIVPLDAAYHGQSRRHLRSTRWSNNSFSRTDITLAEGSFYEDKTILNLFRQHLPLLLSRFRIACYYKKRFCQGKNIVC